MLSGVIFDRQELKVLQSVVVLDPVSVVDVLSSPERAAKMRRHEHTVLQLETVAHSDGDVAVRAHETSSVLSASATLH